MTRRMIGLTLLVLVFSVSVVALALGTLDAGDGADGAQQTVSADEAPFIGLTRDATFGACRGRGSSLACRS